MAESLKHKAVTSVLWRVAEQGGKQLTYFIISVILARLIAPDQFGMIAMLTVFTAVSTVFIDAGFSNALIRKTNRTHADCCTVFWFNVLISVACYVVLFFCSPLIARFYGMPLLSSILRVSALTLIISAFAGVHRSLLQAEMKFKLLTMVNLLSVISAGIVGIIMAFMGFEVWALVGQNLTLTTVSTLCILAKIHWRPSFLISRASFKEFFAFGSKLLASSLLDTIYSNVYSIVIGKVYKAADLAFYNRAHTLGALTSSLPTTVLQSVTYPTLCRLQDDEEALKQGYRRMLRMSAFIIFPLCLGMGAVAFPLIKVVYTDVWMYAATLLSILVFSQMWYPIHAINLNYLIVKGRSDLFFRLEVIKKIQGVIVLCITVPMGLEAMCYGTIVTSLLSLVWNTHYTGKFLKMSIWSQLNDFKGTLLLCAVMYLAARGVAWYIGNNILSLICSVATGAVIYVGGALLFRFPEVKEVRDLKK